MIVVQRFRPDRYFSAAQQQRLQELMHRWRAARDTGAKLLDAEQAELDALVNAESVASLVRRAESVARGLVQ